MDSPRPSTPAPTPTILWAALPLGIIFLAVLLPYGAALKDAFQGDEGPAIVSAIRNPRLGRILAFTFQQAFGSTLVALALGLPGAWLIGAGRFKGAATIRALSAIPFALPPILVVLAFVLFFGNSGWANRIIMALTGLPEGPIKVLYKPSAILLAHGFYNFPIVLRLVGDSMARSRSAYARSAASLGSSPIRAAVTVLLPLSLPSVLSASLLVFLYCFTSFAVVLVLGGGPHASTLAVEIYRSARISLDFETAGSMAFIETAAALGVLGLYAICAAWARNLTGTQESVSRELGKQGEARGKNLFTIVYLGGLALFVGGPLLSIPIESFLSRSTRAADIGFSLRWWRELGTSVLPALGRSLVLGSAAAGIATVLALMAALAKSLPGKKMALGSGLWLDALVSATLVSSGIVLGLGWIRLYGPLASRSFWALALVHGVIALPFAYRSVGEGLASIPPSMLKASATMGDPPWRTVLFVVLPASARYIRSAWAFAMTISLGELNGALMLGIEEFETLPLLVYRATGAYRFGTACAAGTVLALACAGSFMLSKEKA